MEHVGNDDEHNGDHNAALRLVNPGNLARLKGRGRRILEDIFPSENVDACERAETERALKLASCGLYPVALARLSDTRVDSRSSGGRLFKKHAACSMPSVRTRARY